MVLKSEEEGSGLVSLRFYAQVSADFTLLERDRLGR
jgi:hypothetical protein